MRRESGGVLFPVPPGGLIASILFEAAGAWLVFLWLRGGAAWTVAAGLALHAASAFSLWRGAPDAARAAEDQGARSRRFFQAFAAFIVLFFPVMGLPGVGLILLAHKFSRRKGLVEVVTEEMKRAALAIGVERVDDLDSFLVEEASVEPILEILKGSDVGLKRGAVSLLGSIGGQEAVGLLKQSLSDASPEVRFYAHATLAKLEDSHAQEIKAAEESAHAGDAGSWVRLGDAFSRYSVSGLAEEVVRGQLLERAASAYDRALEANRDDSALLIKLGRLHLGNGRFGEARRRFEAVPDGDPARADALLGLCEIAYELRDHAALAGLRFQLAGQSYHSDDPRRIVLYRFWAQGGDNA